MFKADSAYSTKAEPGRGAPPLPSGRLGLSGGLWGSLGGLGWAGASSRASGQKAALLLLFSLRSLFPSALSPFPRSRSPLSASAGVGAGLFLWALCPSGLGSSPGVAAGGAVCSVGRLCGAVPSVRPLGCALPLAVSLCVSSSAVLWGCPLGCWCRLCGGLGKAGQWCWVLGWC